MRILINTTFEMQVFYIANVQDGALIWNAIRDAQLIRSSEMQEGCGDITEKGKVIATVSYNGRILDNDGKEILA